MHLDAAGLELAPYRGGLALLGPSLARAVAHFGLPEPQHPLHITLLTAAERKAAMPSAANTPSSVLSAPAPAPTSPPTSHVYVLGPPATSASVSWLPVLWNHGDVFRASLGLPPKDYHITLSASDDHTLDKGVDAPLRRLLHEGLEPRFELEAQLDATGMDHAVLAARDQGLKAALATRLVAAYPLNYRGYARLAAASDGIVAAAAYARASALQPSLLPAAGRAIARLRDAVPYSVVSDRDAAALDPSIAAHLAHPWPLALGESLSHLFWPAPVEKRARVLTPGGTLPRFFSWIYPARLAGMSTPRRPADIDNLSALGITHVLSLTEEEPLPGSWFPPTVTHLFVPIANYAAPTLGEMDAIHARVAAGGRWAVHCGGGVGRAGTVLACLVAMFGRGDEEGDRPKMDARAAIALLRGARPTSIETREQEEFVGAWVRHRCRADEGAVLEPVGRLVVEGPDPGRVRPRALVLVGRPGSGKSWLAGALAKRAHAVVVSGDEDGRAACERAAAQAGRSDRVFVLDRCNPTAAERREWLALLPQPAVAVYFDYAREVCAARLATRLGHPTIRAGRGGNALKQVHALMVPPDMSEGWAGILTIGSFAAAREAALLLGGTPALLKFPRTPHLLDLGAATSDDIISQPEGTDLVRGPGRVEEKLDGANMGLSLSWDGRIVAQNRSHWVSSASAPQFKALDAWVAAHDAGLRRILGRDGLFPERYILYGEWMAARHSVHYAALPGLFVAFDLYDRLGGGGAGAFASRAVLERTLRGSGIPLVPLVRTLHAGESLSRREVLRMLQETSEFGRERREGVYVRFERGDETVARGKVVRGDFIAGDAHWGRAPMVRNVVVGDGGGWEGEGGEGVEGRDGS